MSTGSIHLFEMSWFSSVFKDSWAQLNVVVSVGSKGTVQITTFLYLGWTNTLFNTIFSFWLMGKTIALWRQLYVTERSMCINHTKTYSTLVFFLWHKICGVLYNFIDVLSSVEGHALHEMRISESNQVCPAAPVCINQWQYDYLWMARIND